MTLTFAALGHVTNDLLDSGPQPGGSVLYASLAAAALGARSRAVTVFGEDFTGRALFEAAGIALEARRSAVTSTFENRYRDGKRQERLLARADSLGAIELSADVVLACPVIGEVDLSRVRARARVLGAGLQGWLRTADGEGRIGRATLGELSAFAACRAVFLSEHDVAPGDPLVERLIARCEIVALTRGREGARVYVAGEPFHVRALPVTEADPTGAGDVFAAAFLLALGRGAKPLEAAVEASCAASVVVEAPGPTALSHLGELPQRLARYSREVPPPARER